MAFVTAGANNWLKDIHKLIKLVSKLFPVFLNSMTGKFQKVIVEECIELVTDGHVT